MPAEGRVWNHEVLTRALLNELLAEHPRRWTVEELMSALTAPAREVSDSLDELRSVGLAAADDDGVLPTPAALAADRLIG